MQGIYNPFRIGRKSNRRRQDTATRLQRRKEHDSGPGEKEVPMPLSKGDWVCDDPYRYSVKESPKDAWETCNDFVEEHDEDLCKELREDISYLLVVAGLFLAVVTAFTVESYKWLKEDKEDTISDLLVEVVRLLNNSSVQGNARLPEPFTPNRREIIVNQLWFLSMILSLVAVGVGTFCLQWISAFLRTDMANKSSSPEGVLALRQLRFDGLISWGVLQAPAVLLLVVQTSILLFAIGLVYLLWGISHTAALPTVVVGGVSAAILYLANLMPFLQSLVGAVIPATLAVPQCPFKSPTSWLLHNACVLLVAPCLLPLIYLLQHWRVDMGYRLSEWWNRQPHFLTDFLWRQYDRACQHTREIWGPQSSSWSYSYYLVHGIASAMEILVAEPNAVDIIPSCFQVLQQQFRGPESWEMLFHSKLSREEKAMLEGNVSLGPIVGHKDGSSATRIRNLKRDFLNAHIFQHLVRHSRKLARMLLRHRVELYIRIKNSSQNITIPEDQALEQHSDTSWDGDNQDGPIGSSLTCPIYDLSSQDIQEMSQEPKIQFLSCARRLIGTRRFTDQDSVAAARIVVFESAQVSFVSPGSSDESSAEAQHGQLPTTKKQLAPNRSEGPTKIDKIDEPAGIDSFPWTEPPDTDTTVNAPISNVDSDTPESLVALCQHVRHKLGHLPRTAFSNDRYFYLIRDILRLDTDLLEITTLLPLGGDAV